MRGHGFAAAGPSLIDVVRLSVYLPRNARVQMNSMRMGDFKPLSEGEIGQRASGGETYGANTQTTWRAWEYWAYRAKCEGLLGPRPQ
jgi:ribulose-5-phosphate 4-epimerase/fuculose-1-phosphate aldolase